MSSGTYGNVFQANGSATFDGLNKVTISLTSDTNQAVASSLTWSGTYSVQANCAGVMNITTGGSATLNLALYDEGVDFLVSGSDATYTYSGTGNTQPAGCAVSTFSGVYTLTGTGFALSGSAVSGAENGTGLLQFDGLGHVTANITLWSLGAASSTLTLTGTYAVSSNCLGSATVSDASANAYAMSFSLYNANVSNAAFYATLAQNSKFLIAGSGHAIFGQPALAQNQIGGGSCSAASLNGTYSLTLSGRGISAAGAFSGSYQAVGTATFDGQSSVTFSGTANTNQVAGKAFSYAGSYAIPSNCYGTITFVTGSTATFTLVAWGNGVDFNITGADANYVYSGSGNNTRPPCATATLSGTYLYTASGFTMSGTTQTGSADEAGVSQFDGQGNVTATYIDSSAGTAQTSITATGTYAVTSACLASATLMDSNGHTNTLNLVITGNYGAAANLIEANSQFVRSGSAHAAFLNPTQSIGNVASYAVNATPPGSAFVLFGIDLATKEAQAISVPLQTTLLATTVTVNGKAVPLFYVSPGQIDAQMPWEIPGGTVASVVVTNGKSTSNAAAAYVPVTGTPGISVYNTNRAVVTNADGSVNTPTSPASVGDEVVAWFTGGGPVQAAGPLVTGAPAPDGLSWVTGDYTVTVGTVPATVDYIGLTPGSIGLYQVNFTVPSIAKGTYPLQIDIAGQASNKPVITVGN